MNCKRCGSDDLKEESRNWGSVLICRKCGLAKPGNISEWAKTNTTIGTSERAHLAHLYGNKHDTLADAVESAGGWSSSQPANRQVRDPDADAADEEADITTW